MGKKATLLLTRILFQAGTILVVAMTVTAWFAGIISPDQSWLISFLSLGMLPLLAVDLVVAIIWACKRSFWALLPLAAILMNVSFISAMYQFDFRSQDELPATNLTIASYNIHGYVHSDFNKTVSNIVEYMKFQKVDILCMQEFMDEPNEMLDSLWAYYPYRTIQSPYKSMQLAVFSRYPITDSQLIPFPESHNAAMWVDIDFNGKQLRVFNIHFQTTNINQSKAEIAIVRNLGIEDRQGKQAFDEVMDKIHNNASKRAEQVNMVCSQIERYENVETIFVCGDFNDTPASFAYNQISKNLEDGFKSAASGYGSTFAPMYGLFRLDYIFHSKNMESIKYYSPTLSWSDHNPVILEVSL